MDSSKLNDWLQIVGLFGVVGSLLFVGLELQQSRKIAMADVYQQQSEVAINLNVSARTPELLGEVARKRFTGEPLTEGDLLVRQFGHLTPWLIYFENSHFQYQQGLLTDEMWASNLVGLRDLVNDRQFKEWWENSRSGWRESFAQVVDEALAEVEVAETDEN